MNFNEKLIKLRKEKGFSQEELGYKLNVTRQTVSKWELGQTTPEMDKLVEISKIFGVTLDDLTSKKEINKESEEIEERQINNKLKNNSTLKVILLIISILIILAVIFYVFIFSKVLNFGKGVFNKVNNQINSELGNEITNRAINIVDDVTNSMNEHDNELNELKNAILKGIVDQSKEIEQSEKEQAVKKENFEKLFDN